MRGRLLELIGPLGSLRVLALALAVESVHGMDVVKLEPRGWSVRSTVEATVAFKESQGRPTAVWTDFPSDLSWEPVAEHGGGEGKAVAESANATSTTWVLRGAIGGGAVVPGQVGAVLVATESGLSDLHFVWLHDLPSAAVVPERRVESPGRVIDSFPTSLEGAIEGRAFDVYWVMLAKGQRLFVDVVAGRIGSALDPVIRMVDDGGQEVAYQDDGPGVKVDSRMIFKAPETGRYAIELRDVEYRGGSNYFYWLGLWVDGGAAPRGSPWVIGAFPPVVTGGLVTVVEPIGTADFQGVGREANSSETPLRLGASNHPLSTAGAASGPLRLSPPHASSFGWSRWTVAVSEPTGMDTPAAALSLWVQEGPVVGVRPGASFAGDRESIPVDGPGIYCGRFDGSSRQHRYRVPVSRGQRLGVRSWTRVLGSSADLYLELRDRDGRLLLTPDVDGRQQPAFVYEVAQDQVLEVVVEELAGRQGSHLFYAMEVDPRDPGFALQAEDYRLEAEAGRESSLALSVERGGGFGGDIRLALDVESTSGSAGEAEPLITLVNPVIAAGVKQHDLKIRVEETAPAGHLIRLRLIAVGEDGTKPVWVSTAEAIQSRLPGEWLAPWDLGTRLFVGVRSATGD